MSNIVDAFAATPTFFAFYHQKHPFGSSLRSNIALSANRIGSKCVWNVIKSTSKGNASVVFFTQRTEMAGQEERFWRAEKRREKRRVAKQNRARARRVLDDGEYEAVLEDHAIPVRQRVADLHVGSNKARDESTVDRGGGSESS